MKERIKDRELEFKTRKTCRNCNSEKLEEILNLGSCALPGWSLNTKRPIHVPLTLTLCSDCRLVQLQHTTRPDLLWNEEYGYRSGVNQTMREELASIAGKVSELIDPREVCAVLDIGCNDGTLLSAYPESFVKVGFDPSRNVAKFAEGKVDVLAYDFFDAESYLAIMGGVKAKAITAIAMFYDLDDPHQFLSDIEQVLADDGVFVVQQNYLGGMLAQNAFDNMVHEHVAYYSLGSFEKLLSKHNLEIFDVTFNDINGGSFRTFVQKKGGKYPRNQENLTNARLKEEGMELDKPETYYDFALRITENRDKLLRFIQNELYWGKKIYVYGASTRGNTLLQFYGLDCQEIQGAAERNPEKWGKKTVGTNIPIVSEEEARQKADYFLVLPWFFREEFLKREQEFLKTKKMIFPLPKFEVIGGEGNA